MRLEAHPIGHARTHARTQTQLRSITMPNVICVHARCPGSSLMPCRISPHHLLALMGQSRMRTLNSTVLPRSPADEPTLAAQHTCRWCSEHRGELQAGAILCCNRDRIRTITAVPHTHATAGGFPEGIQPLPAGHMHPGCVAQRTCGLQAEPFAQIGRQEAGLCSSRVSAAGRAFPSEHAGFDA